MKTGSCCSPCIAQSQAFLTAGPPFSLQLKEAVGKRGSDYINANFIDVRRNNLHAGAGAGPAFVQ